MLIKKCSDYFIALVFFVTPVTVLAASHLQHVRSKDQTGHSAGAIYGDVIEDLDHVGRIQCVLDDLKLSHHNALVIITSGNVAFYKAKPVLYSLQADNEAHDVSAKHPKVRKQFSQQLQQWRQSLVENPRGWK